MPKESRAPKPDTVKLWHKRLAKIVGSVSLNIEHRHLNRGELIEWANELSDIADAIRVVANR